MNKKRIMIITILIMMIITFVGGTLAYLTWTTGDEDKTNIVFTYNADFQCAVNGGGNITSADVVLVPSSCNNENHAIKRELVVTPTLYNDSMIVDMNLWMNIDSIDSGLSDSQNFRYALTTSSTSCTKNVISSGTFNNRMAGDQITILNKTYTSSSEETYYLYIWLDKAETNVSTSGQSFSISLGGICEGEEELDIPNAPSLASGMIPVKIANDGTVTTVSPGDASWYNYKNKNWANAVLVSSSSRSSYYQSDGKTIKSNQVIPEDNILAYYVWIPSYSYRINGVEEPISISFSKTPQGYRYHPAFLWDNNNDGTISSDEKISGLWIGKFGVGHTTKTSTTSDTLKCSTTTCTNADGLRIKPYLISSPNSGNGSVIKTYDDLTIQFYATRSMERSGNPFGLVSSQVDAHMLKNIDWGAITYLAHSVYGINGEMSGNYTGSSGCASIGTNPNTYTCYDQYGTVTSGVYTQSTSGNITGIFDMLGYSTYIMAYVGDPATYFNGISSIYYDSFLRSSFNTACDGGPCYGHALDEVDGWYDRAAYDFTSVDMRFFARGEFRYGGFGNLFNSISVSTNAGNGLNSIGFKSVIVVFEDENIDSSYPTIVVGDISDNTVSLNYSDNVGVTKYYFGTSDPSAGDVTWTDIASATSGNANQSVTSAGKYYFAVQDSAGNESVSSFDVVEGTFYYYNGSAQASTKGVCVLTSGASSCNLSVPSEVTSSTGPNSSTYYGVSTSTSSNTVTTTYPSTTTKYYAVYRGSWKATYIKGIGVSSIGATSNSCTNYKSTNGTTYSSTSCSVTLPAITASSGYNVLGWYNSSSTKVGDAGGSLTLSANAIFTAKAEEIVTVYQEPILNGAAPILSSGMIPITITQDPDSYDTWADAVTVDPLDSSWYSYENQKWANMVLVTPESRSSYYQSDGVTIKPGVTIPEENILAYYVWIPKYSYKINTYHTAISISFNSTPSGYRSHPAFTFDGDNLGFWVGKFETGIQDMTEHNDKLTCTSETCAKADDLVVKAEYTPKANDTVSTQFYLTRSMERTNNAFGLVSSEVDTHMMRNSEWGAVAYLSHSVYGINDEIRLNNYWGSFQLSSNSYSNTAYVTGRGACEVDADYTGHWEITYFGGADSGSCDEYDGDLLYPQSTTGNITGIFDMSGGTYENVMGYYIGANSNYASNPSKYFGWTDEENLAGFTKSIDSKYWDQYTKEGQSYIKTACNGSVCYGHALSEQFWGSYDYNWYNDSKSWVSAAYPWVQRGGYAESGSSAGIFAFSRDNGENDYYKSWRTVIFSFDN